MSTFRTYFLGCVSERSLQAQQSSQHSNKVKFGVPLSEALQDGYIPSPLVNLLVYIAQEGVTTTDLFRRPGNPTDLKTIMKKLSEGKEVILTNYNFYTLASVVKKFLLKIPGGIFGLHKEVKLLDVLKIDDKLDQHTAINQILTSLPIGTQYMLTLLFGTWFRIVNHSEFNTMSSEAVAKSVAPSLFHSCADNPKKIEEEVVLILQLLIDDFGVASMFGPKNLQYFAEVTRTGIHVREKYKYEYSYPGEVSVPYETALRLFALSLQEEAKTKGFHLHRDAISEEEFSSRALPEYRLPSSHPPSPVSMQTEPHISHPKLEHKTSLSAPEVNQGHEAADDRPSTSQHLSRSSNFSRFDIMRHRQMIRLRKRSNWFLGASGSSVGRHANTSIGSCGSMGGSHDTSIGQNDATSSENLVFNLTVSDTGIVDTLDDMSGAPSDIDSVLDERETKHTLHHPSKGDVLNGNHSLIGLKHGTTSRSKESPDLNTSHITEREVRYFMVENWYGDDDGS